MKRYALACFFALCCLPNLQAQAQTTLKDLIGKVWYPVQRQGNHSAFLLHFDSETTVSGSDGCNGFYTEYSYSAKRGFRLGNTISTDKYCPRQREYFGASFLHQAKTFRLLGDKLTFYDEAGKEIISLYSHLVIDTSPLPEEEEFPLPPKE